MTLEDIVEKLKAALPGIRSVILYGSAAAGDYSPRGSDYNLLVVVDHLGLEELDRAAAAIRRWTAAGNPPPLLFTTQRLRESTDSFPIEIADMKQARRVLFGEDVLEHLQVRTEHLRLQLERELKEKIISLRQGYLAAGGRPRALGRLLLASLPSVLTLMRAALRLFREPVPLRKLDAARRLREYADFDLEVLEILHEWRYGGRTVPGGDRRELFRRYLEVVEKVADCVNNLSATEKEEPKCEPESG